MTRHAEARSLRPVEERPAIGARLREARMRQGLEIADCAAATRIRERYLVAIEDGRYESLPDPAYVNGFVRAYASHLGVAVPQPVRDLPVDREAGHNTSVRPRQVELSATRTTPRQAGVRRPRRWPLVLAVLIVVALVVAVLVGAIDLGF
jgi:cytoskeletal protein RodZ